jgi:hypothetical protein
LPAVACIPPIAMKRILELRGYRVVAEDDLNWALEPTRYESGQTQEPVILPKRGALLAVDIMMDTLIKTKTDLQMYFKLKEQVLGKGYISPELPDNDQPVQ